MTTKDPAPRLAMLLAIVVVVLLLYRVVHAATDAPPPPDVDAGAWAKALYAAITEKHWGIVTGIVLIGIVYPLRRFGPEVLKTQLGGLVLAFAVSLAGSLGIALAAGVAFSWSLAIGSLTTAATAAGVWEWIKAHIPGAQELADKSATVPQASAGRLAGTALRVALLAFLVSCSGSATGDLKTAGRIAWDCTSSERKQAVDVLAPLATTVVLNGVSPDGKHVDLAGLKAATSKASLLTDLGVTLWCAASEAIAAIANPPASPAGSPQTAPLEVDPVVLRAAWTAVKPDAVFVTGVRDAAGNQVVM